MTDQDLREVTVAGRPYATGDREVPAERLGLAPHDVAEETWDERPQLEEEARYEARRRD